MGFIVNMDGKGFAHQRGEGFSCDLSFELRGKIAPFLEVTLGTGEGLVCDSSCVLHYDGGLVIKPWPGLNGTRWLAVNVGDDPAASVMLSTAEPGVAGAFRLSDHGGSLICLVDNLMANGPGVTSSFYARFHKLGLSLVLLEGNGWVFLRSRGDVFEHQLAAGEKICVRATNVAVLSATIDFEPVALAGGGLPEFVTLTGPGNIWLQSIMQASEPCLPGQLVPEPVMIQEMRTGGLAFLNGTRP